jgi:hypothetical protein
VLESAANELPFVIFYWLALSTLLVVVQGDIDSPVGWTGLGVAVLTAGGLAIVLRRAVGARAALGDALAGSLGADWRGAVHTESAPGLGPHAASGGR